MRNAMPRDVFGCRLPLSWFVGVWLLSCAASAMSAEPALAYNRDIRPILAENCFACHGPDSAARKGDLRIDRRDDAVKSGAITPGNLKESKLIDRIGSEDAEEVMPPPKTLKKLTPAQKETLKQWV